MINKGTSTQAAKEKINTAIKTKMSILIMPIPSLSNNQIMKITNRKDKMESIRNPF